MTHTPVLLNEVLKYLDPRPNENFIDATFGFGGHSQAILEKIQPNGKVLGIEIDTEVFKRFEFQVSRFTFHGNLILVNDSYANLKKIVQEQNFKPIHGILFDLGMSSWHLEESGRGFSFQKNEPLDMRYNEEFQNLTAEKIVNEWQEYQIEKILKEYGEERWAKKIAKAVAESRLGQPIKTAFQLVEIVKRAIPKRLQSQRINPATKTFQALRIAVNRELKNISTALPLALEVLEKGGRLAIISFQSLEDRIVKNFLKQAKRENLLRILTEKPITASLSELKQNPRARSAKLRAAIKL